MARVAGYDGSSTALTSKIVRIRPHRKDDKYTPEELADSMWEIEVDGHTLRPQMKSAPNYFALAYKNRVYSKNRVKYPLKRVDWEPGGDPAKINAANRGKSKFERISWDEALDIMEGELQAHHRRATAPIAVLCIGEDGHRESKDLHAGGGMHANLMSKLGGYTRETRTPDSVEGWYWGAKHVLGLGIQQRPGHVRAGADRLQFVERHQRHLRILPNSSPLTQATGRTRRTTAASSFPR